jgi:putative transcriptional regulator
MTDPMIETRSFTPTHERRPSRRADERSETSDAWDAVRSSAAVHRVRWHTGLTQAEFARAYRIELNHLRALERGLVQPDSTLLAYLMVIDRAPVLVRETLAAA